MFTSTLNGRIAPANPILLTVRSWLRSGIVTSYGSALWKINNGGTSGNAAQYEHARKVLERLVRTA